MMIMICSKKNVYLENPIFIIGSSIVVKVYFHSAIKTSEIISVTIDNVCTELR